jgi:hypothetical protein
MAGILPHNRGAFCRKTGVRFVAKRIATNPEVQPEWMFSDTKSRIKKH